MQRSGIAALSMVLLASVGIAAAQTTLLHSFVGGANDGSGPYSHVVQSGTRLYGMCHAGGGWNVGTVFSMDTDGGNYAVIHHFSFGGPVDGQYPNGTPIIDGTKLYGMTSGGGTANGGIIFSSDTDGANHAVLHSFVGGADDGARPQGTPVLVGSRLYGITWNGGDSNLGVVFAIDTDGGNFELLHEFAGTDGKNSQASLTISGTKLYGVTSGGGTNDMGVAFSINTDGSDFAVLHNFSGADGSCPRGEVTVSGARLYGTTYAGGSNDGGVIYSMNSDGSDHTVMHNFTSGGNDGYQPLGGMTLVGSTLYGATSGGGNQGVVYAIETDGSDFALLHVFAGQPGDGGRPGSGRMVVDGATIYGMTGIGGETTNGGVVFSLPIATGACCMPDGSCQDVANSDACAALGGDWQGHGTNCATANCPQPASITVIKDADPADGTDFDFRIPAVFIREWGSQGTGDGQFQNPSSVAVDGSGNVYVADSQNSRIQKFDSDGAFLLQWGSSGSGDGQFSNPFGVAVDGSGNVYVTDYSSDRIQKFDGNGVFLLKWGGPGSGDGQFNRPYCLTVDSNGDVYVADAYNHRIQKFDSNGGYLGQWGSSGTGDGQFNQPCGVGVDAGGNVFVVDFVNNRVQKFDSSGVYLDQWGSSGSGDGQFNLPFGLVLDSSGNVYVADVYNNRIQKFDSNGSYLGKWGSAGAGAGQFNRPHGVAVDSSGNVFVADHDNHRIQKFIGPVSFTLDDADPDDGDGIADSITLTNIPPADYDILEIIPAGWQLAGVDCVGGSYTSIADGLTVHLQASENVTCTFTNIALPGACCLPDGTCQDVSDEAACDTLGGDWKGAGTDCATTTCPVLLGACCATDGTCTAVTEADCTAAGGAWSGVGTSCDPNPCLATIMVEKQTDPDGWPGVFTINISGQGGFSQDVLLSDGEQAAVNVAPGTYAVQEVAPYGWVVGADITCPPGANCGSYSQCQDVTPDGTCALLAAMTCVQNLAAGETYSVDFSNSMTLDFGDAPDSYGTLLASDGARHLWTYPVRLGTRSDPEDDGQPTSAADGDDNDSTDDEDGVTFPNPLVPGATVNIDVDGGAGGGKLDAWLDFNADGVFDHPSEQVAASLDVAGGANSVAITIPAGAVVGQTYARFRISTAGGLAPTGFADDGEAEDYQVDIEAATGTIVIEKQTDPDGAIAQFEFTGDVAGRIYDDGQIVADNLAAGTYSVRELVPFDWELLSIVCDDGNSSGDVGTATVTVQLEAGETVTCVFTNRYTPPAGQIVGWGDNSQGNVDVPPPNESFVGIAGGASLTLGLKADGSVVAWGLNSQGQCDVPAPNSDFLAIAAGSFHCLGLRTGGAIVSWGFNDAGQCDVPTPNTGFVAVAAGGSHSLGLKSDGSVAAWGRNWDGQCDVPAPNADFVAIAAGYTHSLALRMDGSIAAFGLNTDGQCDVPVPNADFVAVAAGSSHSLGLKSDGSIVAWGSNSDGQCDVPAPNADFVSIAGGQQHSLGLKSGGSIVGWGYNYHGQCDTPAPNTDFFALASGSSHSLGVRSVILTGACCLPGDVCQEILEADCVAAGGDWHGVGTSCTPRPCPSVVWTPMGYPGAQFTDAHDIHDDQIVGLFSDGRFHGFLHDGATWTPLDHPDADVYTGCGGIEIVGADTYVVGAFRDSASKNHGFLYDGTLWTTLDADFADVERTGAMGISGGRIVGSYGTTSGVSRGYIYDATQPPAQQWSVLDYPGADGTHPQSIDGDRVVGFYEDGSTDHGFYLDLSAQPPAWTALDFPGVDITKTQARGIDGNHIVGWFMVGGGGAGNVHGFLYDRNTQQWTQVDHPGAPTTSVYGIHGGKMVGTYTTRGDSGFLAEFASACCLPDAPYCEIMTEDDCLFAGGTWTGPNVACGIDCNLNGISDACEIAQGLAQDCDGDWIPDECEVCGDLDSDSDVDYDDYVIFLDAFGGAVDGVPPQDACCDYDGTGAVGMLDYDAWLTCYRAFIGNPQAGPPSPPMQQMPRRRAMPTRVEVIRP